MTVSSLDGRTASPRSRVDTAREVVALAAAFLMAFPIDVGGRVYVGEIVLILALPWLALSRRRDRRVRLPVWLLVLGGLWLAGQVISDLLADSAPPDSMRAWSKIVLALMDLAALSLLLNSDRVIRIAVLGLCAGLLAVGVINPTADTMGDPWKWLYGYPVTLLLVLSTTVGPIARHPRVTVALILGTSVASLVFDFRSLALTSCLAAIVLIARSFALNHGMPDESRIRMSRRFGIAALIGGGLLLVQAYSFAAGNGLLGPDAQHRYEVQAGSALGLLVGGRVEILFSAQAFADAPVFGHGAYAQDFAYLGLLADRLDALGYPVSVPADARIPTHSYLMGSAVEAGLLGFVFWLATAIAVVRWLWTGFAVRSALTALSVFMSMQLLWDIFFSPFDGYERIKFALAITVALYIAQHGIAQLPGLVRRKPLDNDWLHQRRSPDATVLLRGSDGAVAE